MSWKDKLLRRQSNGDGSEREPAGRQHEHIMQPEELVNIMAQQLIVKTRLAELKMLQASYQMSLAALGRKYDMGNEFEFDQKSGALYKSIPPQPAGSPIDG